MEDVKGPTIRRRPRSGLIFKPNGPTLFKTGERVSVTLWW